jgi:hypothetical protein
MKAKQFADFVITYFGAYFAVTVFAGVLKLPQQMTTFVFVGAIAALLAAALRKDV